MTSAGADAGTHRPTLRCVGCNHCLDEQPRGLCPACGRVFDPLDPTTVNTSGRPIGRWARWCLRADPRPLLVLALALTFWYFWEYRSPAAAMVALAYYVGFCFGIVLFGLLAVSRGVQLFVRNSCASRYRVHPDAFRCRRRFWPWFVMLAAATCLMLWFRVPLRVCFLLSRPALDRVAERALADEIYADSIADQWVGVYRIAGVKVIGSTVVIYVGKKDGDYGFARVPGMVQGNLVFNRPGAEERPGYHRDFPRAVLGDPLGERIAGDWFVMFSSYWALKLQRRTCTG